MAWKKHQGTDFIFVLFIFWTANSCLRFVSKAFTTNKSILNINLLKSSSHIIKYMINNKLKIKLLF